ncbi:hypothetical protein JW756_02185 [Candidatus Woesearchaeota archaeon]|nr:hypothetical protein [Candidatus Woesearchaeota archaeon]
MKTNKKAQFSETQTIIIAVIIFTVLAIFVGMIFGWIPAPQDIFKNFFNKLI